MKTYFRYILLAVLACCNITVFAEGQAFAATGTRNPNSGRIKKIMSGERRCSNFLKGARNEKKPE